MNSFLRDDLEKLSAELQELEDVAELAQSRGWNILKKFFVESMEKLKDALMSSEDEKLNFKYRERYSTLNSILQAVDAQVDNREFRRQELEELIELRDNEIL